jgi:hypothetical protein
MNMIYKIIGYTLLWSSFVGNGTAKPSKAGFGTSEWAAPKVKWACEVVCDTVETVAKYGKKTSQWIDEKSTELRNYSQEWIYAQDGYNHSEFKFQEKAVEDDWVLIAPEKI